MSYENNSKIQLLCEYLRIPTVHPNINYEPCTKFFRRLADELDLPFHTYYSYKSEKPIVIITWPGLQPNIPSVMFNSHMDVTSVDSTNWIYPPFSGYMDDNGIIYGRGVQNSKALAIQYIAAIHALKNEGFQGQRTAHLTVMPDKEIGGIEGMKTFVMTSSFRQMNVGFALDGGVASPTEECPVFYAERIRLQPTFTIRGPSGDVSLSPKATAGEKFNYILNQLMNYRDRELRKFNENKNLSLGDVTSVNLTMLDSREDQFCLPETIVATFDIRLSLKENPEQFIQQLHQWAKEAGDKITIKLNNFEPITDETTIDKSNEFWNSFQRICEQEEILISPRVLPHASDGRFLRQAGIPTLNFSPMPNTPPLAYDANEYLDAEIFLDGIEFYKKLIPALLNSNICLDNTSN